MAMEEYGEKYKGVTYTFVRIGEEDGDVEIDNYGDSDRGSACRFLYPVTSINWEI